MNDVVILVCGGRNYNDTTKVDAVLDQAYTTYSHNLVIVHGACTGADSLAEEWCKRNGVRFRGYPADWVRLKGAAGPIRNLQMLDEKPAWVLAFPGGDGTANMVQKARCAGLNVVEIV